MDKDKLMELLRNPKKHQQKRSKSRREGLPPARSSRSAPFVLMGVLFLICISLLFIFAEKRKAENIPDFMDKNVLKGLMVDRVFSPQPRRVYIQISEGADRTLPDNGATLPVISLYNLDSFSGSNYELIGKAPWALSINIVSNAKEPRVVFHLLNQDKMIGAYLARPEIAAVLNDPAALAELAKDEEALQTFFAQEAAQKVLASEDLMKAYSTSRFFSYLLISKAVKYYRDNPQEAAQLIRNSPTLSSLKRNPFVRQAVSENRYLKNIASTLLQ